ncbi:MAG: double-strand break repair helicase AddA [Pseudomonadota bacterium]
MTNEATKRQLRAAEPGRSTWLTANAGSGKTRVLTERVARLLLEGVEPQRILCLTYTKAAASEMQNRLFATLGAWAMQPEPDLREALAAVGADEALSAEEISRARTLFARAIETPGGLKIQTIHAFCAAILRRFPLEAGVSPDFREMDQRVAHLMQREVIEVLAEAGSAGFSAMAAEQSSDDLGAWLDELLRHKSALSQPKTMEMLWAEFDLPPGYDWAAHAEGVLAPGDGDLLSSVSRLLATSGANDKKLASQLAALDLSQQTHATFGKLEELLVYGAETKNPFTPKSARVPTKAGKDILCPELTERFHDLMERLAKARPRRTGLLAAARTWALHAFAADFLPAYEAKKAEGGWLDFDDLITRTRALLARSEVAAWVLYRLDGGIDHILVDEAQDTSPEQWEIIKALATEILAGQGAREDVQRTVFVVGDKKQSIYSFQGADPRAFDRSQAHFGAMLEGSDTPLQTLALEHSFRSAPAILDVVDRVFKDGAERGLGQESRHIAFKDRLPGRVDLLTPIEGETGDPPAWYEAVDTVSAEDPTRRLAEDTAARIKGILASATLPVVDRDGRQDRPAEPKDILILVQRRSAVFSEIIRACKNAGIPLAGADQLNVAQELAVKDITALLNFLATPEDDLSLAVVLKSPLFGWDERALFELAHHRVQTYLWPALRDREPDFPETVSRLQRLLSAADFLRPFELIDRILTREGGRRAIVARLGPEAEDAIDALLAQAIAYEQTEPPSLSGFLTWLAADDLRVKRAIDGSANVVRVMTVHGAKGLEAPIVILPDTSERRAARQSALLKAEFGPVWAPKTEDMPTVLAEAREDGKRLAQEERQRLLYVAMTRAENWLIVGAAGKSENSETSWHAQISGALEGLPLSKIEGGVRYEPMPWPKDMPRRQDERDADATQLNLPAPAPVPPKKLLRPSDLGGAKTLAGTDEDADALARGTALHDLLETLPPLPRADWKEAAERRGASEMLEAAVAILDDPVLAHLFAEDSLAEVDVTAQLPTFPGQTLRGSIDRLVIKQDHVLTVDFKSNRVVPEHAADVPEGILRQLGAYASALEKIFPDKRVETAILWTETRTLMPLSTHHVHAALARAASG